MIRFWDGSNGSLWCFSQKPSSALCMWAQTNDLYSSMFYVFLLEQWISLYPQCAYIECISNGKQVQVQTEHWFNKFPFLSSAALCSISADPFHHSVMSIVALSKEIWVIMVYSGNVRYCIYHADGLQVYKPRWYDALIGTYISHPDVYCIAGYLFRLATPALRVHCSLCTCIQYCMNSKAA